MRLFVAIFTCVLLCLVWAAISDQVVVYAFTGIVLSVCISLMVGEGDGLPTEEAAEEAAPA